MLIPLLIRWQLEGQCWIAGAWAGYLGDEMETSRLPPGHPFGGWQCWAAGSYSWKGEDLEGASHLMSFGYDIFAKAKKKCRTDHEGWHLAISNMNQSTDCLTNTRFYTHMSVEGCSRYGIVPGDKTYFLQTCRHSVSVCVCGMLRMDKIPAPIGSHGT